MVSLEYLSVLDIIQVTSLLALLSFVVTMAIKSSRKEKPVQVIEGYVHPMFIRHFVRWVENSETGEEYLAMVKDKKEEHDMLATILVYIDKEELEKCETLNITDDN